MSLCERLQKVAAKDGQTARQNICDMFWVAGRDQQLRFGTLKLCEARRLCVNRTLQAAKLHIVSMRLPMSGALVSTSQDAAELRTALEAGRSLPITNRMPTSCPAI